MSTVAIRAEGLGKRYEVGALRPGHSTLRETLVAAGGRWRRVGRDRTRPFWALRDVGFEVHSGEVLGIVGGNGAGKSTLLRILSRITPPTMGEADVHGRVGSLLEVGTGFHGELSGRENIYLAGAILGMRRAEIARLFDAIVAFAEVDAFLDTPVKRYSSGMYLRLAFAVAAHFEPDILIVDEVLAVGDVAFQRKCLRRMDEVATRDGRTVLFVSHNLAAVQRLCDRALLLERGRLVASGPTSAIVARYLASQGTAAGGPLGWIDVTGTPRTGSGEARVEALRWFVDGAAADAQPLPGGPLTVELVVASGEARTPGNIAVTLYDAHGTKLVNADTLAVGAEVALRPGRTHVTMRIDALHLNPGVYTLGFWIAGRGGGVWDFTEAAVRLEVVEPANGLGGIRPAADGLVPCRFTVATEPE